MKHLITAISPLLPRCRICYSCHISVSEKMSCWWCYIKLVELSFVLEKNFAGKFEPSGRKQGMKRMKMNEANMRKQGMKMNEANMKVKPDPRTLISERGEGWAASLKSWGAMWKAATPNPPIADKLSILNFIIPYYLELSRVIIMFICYATPRLHGFEVLYSQVPHQSLVISLIFDKMWPLPMVVRIPPKVGDFPSRASCCKWCHHSSLWP